MIENMHLPFDSLHFIKGLTLCIHTEDLVLCSMEVTLSTNNVVICPPLAWVIFFFDCPSPLFR